MKMLQDVTDWFKAEILGDQSLQQERKKLKSQKDFEKRINEAARHVCLSDRPNDDGAPYPVICMDGTVIYKICENPRIEKGEISLEDVGGSFGKTTHSLCRKQAELQIVMRLKS